MLLGYTTNPLYFTYIYFRDISNCHTSCYPLSNHISIQIYESFKDISNNYTSYYFLSNHDITLLRVLKKVKSEIDGGNNSEYTRFLSTCTRLWNVSKTCTCRNTPIFLSTCIAEHTASIITNTHTQNHSTPAPFQLGSA